MISEAVISCQAILNPTISEATLIADSFGHGSLEHAAVDLLEHKTIGFTGSTLQIFGVRGQGFRVQASFQTLQATPAEPLASASEHSAHELSTHSSKPQEPLKQAYAINA